MCWAIRPGWTDTLDSSLCLAALAIPVANWNFLQIDAIRMIIGVAAIAGEKLFLVIIITTDETRLVFYLFVVVFNEHRRIDIRNLSSVADRVGRKDGP